MSHWDHLVCACVAVHQCCCAFCLHAYPGAYLKARRRFAGTSYATKDVWSPQHTRVKPSLHSALYISWCGPKCGAVVAPHTP